MHSLSLDWATFAVQVVTLIVLGIYAFDTNRMKREMLRQGVASRRPFLTVHHSWSDDPKGQFVCNAGQGVAYNVSWKFGSDNPTFPNVNVYLGSLSVGTRAPLVHFDGTTLQTNLVREFPIRFEYDDAAGKRYWSTVVRKSGPYVIETGETEKP
jgi:hypothetical protein